MPDPVVIIDILDGSAGTRDRDGWKAMTRKAIVTGVTGTGQDQFNTAFTATGLTLAGGGSAHGTEPSLHLTEAGYKALGAAKIELILTYSRNDSEAEGGGEGSPAQLTIGTTLEQQQATGDIGGNLMKVTYTGAITKGIAKIVGGKASVLLPKTTLQFSRTETLPPGDKSQAYTGKVNSGAWTGIDAGAAARVWLCLGIVGTSTDGGQSYRVNYDFARAPQAIVNSAAVERTWDTFIYFNDPETGEPPSDVLNVDYSVAPRFNEAGQEREGAAPNGWERYQMYATVDFTALNLAGVPPP